MSAAARVWLRLVVMVALRSARAAEVVEWTPAEKTIYLLGNVPQSTQRAEWLGEYERQGVSKLAKKGLVDGRPYYANKADAAKFMWFNKHSGRWYVGKARAVGHAAGVLHVSDVAAAPEQITAKWQAWIGPQKGWIEAPELKVLAGEQGRAAVQADAAALTNAPPTLLLAGKTPGSVRHEWLGVYEKQSALVNRRHYYAKRADAAKMMWYSAKTGTWYVGAKSALGKQNGVLMAHDVAVSPERITPGAWTVGQGDGKGWIAAPELRCLHGTEESAALLAAARTLEASPRTVYLLGAKPTAEADASATAVAEKTALWQGAYSALIDETTGRPSVEEGRYTYTRSGPTGGVWSLWYDARRGAWYVSHRRSKRQAAAKAKHLLSAYDSAILPQQVRASWRKSLKGSWVSAAASGETVKVVGGEEGAALLREQMEATTRALAQSAESVLLVGIAAPAPRHEWMGRYVRHGAALVHGRHVLVHEEDETKVLWYDAKSASWCVAMHEALALQQMRYFPNRAVLRATDPSLAPERVAAPWKVREETSDHESWLGVPGLRCIAAPGSEGAAELRTQEQAISRSDRLVYLVGQTPPAFAREWMGPYERQALPAAKESSSTAGRRPSYRRQGDPSKLLTYNAHTGEWRAERPDATTGQPVTMMSTYDGAIVPERIAAPWRVFSDIGWEDAPEVHRLHSLDLHRLSTADIQPPPLRRCVARWVSKASSPSSLTRLPAAPPMR